MTAPAVYLASKSPRREELLRQLGVEFASLRVREVVGARARRRSKARATPSRRATTSSASRAPRRRSAGSGCCSAAFRRARCSAPTPRSCSTARSSASRRTPPTPPACSTLLSGRTHQVLTAVALCWEQQHRRRDLDVGGDVPRARPRRDRALRRDRRAVRQGRRLRGSRAAPRRSCSASTAATPASWVCRCTRPRDARSPASGSPCYNATTLRCRMKSSST